MQTVIVPLNEKLWLSELEVKEMLSLSDWDFAALKKDPGFPEALTINRRSRKYWHKDIDAYARTKFGIGAGASLTDKMFAQ